MKKLKLSSKISIVLSLLLVGFGIWNIADGEYLTGFIFISYTFAISINDWINVFKKK
jgi:hypothetical protein